MEISIPSAVEVERRAITAGAPPPAGLTSRVLIEPNEASEPLAASDGVLLQSWFPHVPLTSEALLSSHLNRVGL